MIHSNNNHEAFGELTFHQVNLVNVKDYIKTQNEIFPEDDATLHGYAACDINLFKKITDIEMPVNKSNYFLASSHEDYVGITGLYTYVESNAYNECWLGWYGVRKMYRGRGYGQSILEWTINKATIEGYDFLRLYTVAGFYDNAVKVYEKMGFMCEPYTLEFENFYVYSLALTGKPMLLINGRFMNFAKELDICRIPKSKTDEISKRYDEILGSM